MPNRLAETQSLYLRKHADNPIDWWYWCDRALDEAETEDKPIFLSIGYSSCHWCTVMEGEAFSDPQIADYLNSQFVAIKVDREERPDLDSIYMNALQLMAGQGGWPLNIFLTPGDLVPFYAGTYFPLQPAYGRPGFLQVLQSVRHFYDVEKGKLEALKGEIINNLQQLAVVPVSDSSLDLNLLKLGIETSAGVIGNSSSPNRFPMIPYANLTLAATRLSLSYRYDVVRLAEQQGKVLVEGGIFDHVGGGFHRYTVDPTWTVPHFEKMLYDNGQIVEYLANLWSSGYQEPAVERAVALTVEWLSREMTSPLGYFYASQDADSFKTGDDAEPEEGAFYVWSWSELESLLDGETLQAIQAEFTVTSEGNFEGYNVLQRRGAGELSQTVQSALDQLFKVRYGTDRSELERFEPATDNNSARQTAWAGRIPPVTDTKMIVAWNSLMISGLARAAAVFGHSSYLDLAIRAAEFILTTQRASGQLFRLNYDGQPTVAAQAEDYALLIKALLDLHAASPTESRWLNAAEELQVEFGDRFWSKDGGYYNNGDDRRENLLIQERSYIDNATPAANGVAAANCVRLALLTDNLDYLLKAELTLQAFTSPMSNFPQACPSLFTALDWYLHATSASVNESVISTLQRQYLPTTVWLAKDDLSSGIVGLVCHRFACLEPSYSIGELQQQIKQIELHSV